MASVIGEATITLPEGATVCLQKQQTVRPQGGLSTKTVLRAWHNKAEVSMTVDDVSPNNLQQYLELCVREINRHRSGLKEKPKMIPGRLDDFHSFVVAMAYQDMFIFNAFTTPTNNSTEAKDHPNGHTEVAKAGGKVSKQRRIRDNQSST